MPDFGTLVADSKGILHDVSKHMFNSVKSKLDNPLDYDSEVLTQSFEETFNHFKTTISEKYNINIYHTQKPSAFW